jgi:hypothetical protein
MLRASQRPKRIDDGQLVQRPRNQELARPAPCFTCSTRSALARRSILRRDSIVVRSDPPSRIRAIPRNNKYLVFAPVKGRVGVAATVGVVLELLTSEAAVKGSAEVDVSVTAVDELATWGGRVVVVVVVRSGWVVVVVVDVVVGGSQL